MLRLAGLLTGSTVAIALILLILGIPELPPAEESPPPPAEAVQPVVENPMPEAIATPEEPEPIPLPALTETEPEMSEPEPTPVRWHAFWSPFGSRIAADGFVSRLESVTGFDYRVVKVDNGVFEVAFAHTTDTERDEMLAVIASAAGLELPDS
jgi:hypothetical protein